MLQEEGNSTLKSNAVLVQESLRRKTNTRGLEKGKYCALK